MPLLELENITFGYKDEPVIKNFNLSVEKSEFTTLLGASGCGKTTVLRLISGFLNPQGGLIKINGEIQNRILPNKRKIGIVFQDYALFPHLTVEQNLYYGLKLKSDFKKNKKENEERVNQVAKNLGLEKLLKRLPGELSGGQQQRVALGRSLVLEPEILLMDEPLSSLDTNLRVRVREELKEIQQELKITTIYVTHDQEEALSLSDKIAVMKDGKIIQYDNPHKLYFEPKDEFVANFVGRANIIYEGEKKYLVRPEWIKIQKLNEGIAQGNAKVLSSSFFGDVIQYKLDFNGRKIVACTNSVLEVIKQNELVNVEILRKWPL